MPPIDDLYAESVRYLDQEAWHGHQYEADPVLYHYTDSQGLKGIFDSRKLWLSDTRHLNDQREQVETRDATMHAIEWMIERFPESPNRLAHALKEIFDSVIADGPRSALLFAGCFSTDDDSLPQWRSYGRGEGGFAIGFKASRILALGSARLAGQGLRLLPCTYDAGRYRVALNRAVELAESEFSRLSSEVGEAFALSEFMQRVAWYGSALKNNAFRSESEWRLIYHHIPAAGGIPMEVKHLATRTFRPYVELSLGDDAAVLDSIVDVVIGPQRHMDLAAEGLTSYLATTLGGCPTIRKSVVPFRSME